jgi:pimeloyl-ACP methyl ester carboxylesterase
VGRMNVLLARSWARQGYLVLRMDLAGIGDSPTRAGRPSDEVFPPGALKDIAHAIEFIRTSYGISDVTLAGLCSGAYHALRAAVANLPVNRILMVNPENFFWKEGSKLEELQVAEVVRNPAIYKQRFLSLGAWRRVLSGEVNLWRVVKIYFFRPLLAVESKLRDLTRWLHIRLPNDLGWELEHIDSRALRIVFVFARGEPGIDLLRIEAGSSVRRLGERCRVYIIDGADHTFSKKSSQAVLEQILSDELFAKQPRLADAMRAGASDSRVERMR